MHVYKKKHTRAAVNSCIVVDCMTCTFRVLVTYLLAFTTNDSEKQCQHLNIF